MSRRPCSPLIASSVELGFGGQIQEMAAEGKFAPKIVGGLNERFTHPNSKWRRRTGSPSNKLATADLLDGKIDAQVQDSTAAVYMGRRDPRLAPWLADDELRAVERQVV